MRSPPCVSESAHGAHIRRGGPCDSRRVPRPLRIDFEDAWQHVYIRGNARGRIALDDLDYRRSLDLLAETVARFDLLCHACSALPNHSHFVFTSRRGNLSRAMHWMGTAAARAFNERHARSGHVYQGRFGSRLIESDAHFLELMRYLPLNPVRAGLCAAPEDWPWSSYAATAGLVPAPPFLHLDEVLGMLGSTAAYVKWVALGTDPAVIDDRGAPRLPPIGALLSNGSSDEIRRALERGYTQQMIAAHLGLSQAQVSRRLRRRRV
jgi:REP element-mobilizing transposase RayT